MRSYLGHGVAQRFRRSPRYGHAVVYGVCGPLISILIASIILGIDHTATATHMSEIQDGIAAVAMTVLVALFVASWMRAWFELRGVALVQADEFLVVRSSWTHRVLITSSLVQNVTLAVDPKRPSTQVAELILRDGHLILIPLARQRVGHHGHASGIHVALAPLGDPTAALPAISTTCGTRDNQAPRSAIAHMSDGTVKSRRRSAITFWSAVLPIAVFASVRTSVKSVVGLVAIFLGAMLFFGAIRLISVRQMPQEVSITATSLSIKRFFQRTWLTFDRAAVVCVSQGQTGIRQARSDGLYVCDAVGQRIVLSATWLSSDLAAPLRALLLDHPATTASARTMLNASQ